MVNIKRSAPGFLPTAFLLLAVAGESSAALLNGWEAYMSPGFELDQVAIDDAVDGQYAVKIQSPMQNFDDLKEPGDVTKYHFGYLDYLYLSQSVNCAEFVNQHVHVSGYFRLDKTEVKSHIQNYENWIKKRIIEYRKEHHMPEDDPMDESLLKRFSSLLQDHEVEIFVFMQTDKKTYQFSSTGVELKNISQWQRINVEIDVPKQCKMLTVSAYFKGVGVLQLDDFVVNTQGEKIDETLAVIATVDKHDRIYETLKKWYKKYKTRKAFRNLSFENSVE